MGPFRNIEDKHGTSGDGDEPREFPMRSRLRRIVWGVVGLLVVLVVAGGIADALNGGTKAPTAAVGTKESNTPGTNGTPEANGFSGEGCTSGPANANVRITIYGGETCAEWDRTQSASGTFWREVSFPPASVGEELVCSMEGPGDHTLIEVRDIGEHFYGNRICALLTSENWHNAEGPGEKLEQSRKAHEAQEHAEHEQQREREAQQRREAEKPKLQAAAAKLRNEAAGLRQKQHAEEAAVKHDEAESSRLSHDAEGAEGEASANLNEQAANFNSEAATHDGNVDSDKDEAEPKESEAAEDEKKASEDQLLLPSFYCHARRVALRDYRAAPPVEAAFMRQGQ
jgi:hypothetical protein